MDAVLLEQGGNIPLGQGLFEEIQRPQFHDAFTRLRLDVAGHHDRHGGQILRANRLQNLITIHVRHVEIQKQDVTLTGFDRRQRLDAVAGKAHTDVPILGQGLRQLLAGKTGVVADEYGYGHGAVSIISVCLWINR
jgi:hypothetical protein